MTYPTFPIISRPVITVFGTKLTLPEANRSTVRGSGTKKYRYSYVAQQESDRLIVIRFQTSFTGRCAPIEIRIRMTTMDGGVPKPDEVIDVSWSAGGHDAHVPMDVLAEAYAGMWAIATEIIDQVKTISPR